MATTLVAPTTANAPDRPSSAAVPAGAAHEPSGRLISRTRGALTVLGTLAVIVAEFVLLAGVYHHGEATRRPQLAVAQLAGQLSAWSPAVDAHAGTTNPATTNPATTVRLAASAHTVVADLRHWGVSDPAVSAVEQRADALQRTPSGDAVAALAAATDALGKHLASDNDRAAVEADVTYAVLLVVASIGWMLWFRRLVARHRKLQQQVTAAELTVTGERRLATLVRNAADLVMLCATDGSIQFATSSARSVLGLEPDELVGRVCLDLVDPADRENLWVALSTLRPDEDRELTVRMHHADGRVLHVEGTITDLSAEPSVGALLITVRDVTTKVDLEAQLRQQAFYDSLTGLANRQLFTDRLEHALTRVSVTGGEPLAVLFCDLDEFKNINDSLGHPVGDEVLAQVARRVRSVTRDSDTVARLGGDEFAVLLEQTDLAHATQTATQLLEALSEPLEASGHLLVARASIGIALGTADTLSADEVLRNADVAMYLAKERGKGTVATYDVDLHSLQLDRLTLRTELEDAIEHDELVALFQPILDLGEARIIGFEALARWEHPTRGLLGPEHFIPVAERTGLIHAVGREMLRQACRAGARFARSGADSPYVSVNVTAAQLARADFVAEVRHALRDAGLPARSLMIEITESVLLSDVAETVDRLTALRGLGVRVAIDDFGTGYSSLAYLRDLPLDVLKIDKSFVDRTAGDGDDAELTAVIVTMSRALGLATVAEGVERAEQASWLIRSGCGYGQGFLWSRPVSVARAEALATDGISAAIPAPETIRRAAAQRTRVHELHQ